MGVHISDEDGARLTPRGNQIAYRRFATFPRRHIGVPSRKRTVPGKTPVGCDLSLAYRDMLQRKGEVLECRRGIRSLERG